MINPITYVYSYFSSSQQGPDGPSTVDQAAAWLGDAADDAYDAIFGTSSITGCSVQQPEPDQRDNTSGVHYYLTGDARGNWSIAANQVLRYYCGLAEPSAQQVAETSAALREANEQHLQNDVWGVISYDISTPAGVDHRIGSFFSSDIEIFIPTPTPIEICPMGVLPELVAPPVDEDPVAQPDAGTADADEVDTEVDTGEPETSPPVPIHVPRPRPTKTHTPAPPDTGPTKPPPPTTADPVVPL